MLKLFFLFFIVSHSFGSEDPDYEMRVSWVKTLKTFLLENQKKDQHLVVDKTDFFNRLSLLSHAWADSRYNCFYGGWPSVKVGKYCKNPSTTNSSYDKSACQKNELQCQPLLFGKNKCVSGLTLQDRQKSFSNCEKKSDAQFKFLKNMSRKETEDLRELSELAIDLCQKEKSFICKKVLDRARSGLKSIDRAFIQAVSSNEAPVNLNLVASMISNKKNPPVKKAH
jgi:hypothetical protein